MRTERAILRSSLLFGAILSIASLMSAQQQPTTPPPPNQPIELPEFIVTGKQQVDIPGGSKQSPTRPPLLSRDRLDSLNPIEKLPLPQIAPTPLPHYQRTSLLWPGYAEASVGAYLTPKIEAGYGFRAGEYAIDLAGDFESSSGWVDNSDYAIWNINALSTYVAPEQFLFFAGSTTEVDLGIGQRSYSLYADSTAPDRSVFRLDAGIRTEGTYEGLTYIGAAAWSSRSIDTQDSSASDNGFDGLLDVRQRLGEWDLGVLVDLRLRSFAGMGYPYSMLGGRADWSTSDVAIRGRAGLQWASSTSNVDRFGARLDLGAVWTSSPFVTIGADLSTGLQPIAVRDLLIENPFLSDTMLVDIPYDVVQINGDISWHPNTRINVFGAVSLRQTDRDLIWVAADRGTFSAEYRTTTTIGITADLRYGITSKDYLLANVNVTSSSVDDGEATPYIAPFKAMLGYERTWSIPLTTALELFYVGDRWADLANTVVLSGYIDLRLKASYRVGDNLDIFVRGTNLVGSDMELWQGYRERGIFITGGITWKF